MKKSYQTQITQPQNPSHNLPHPKSSYYQSHIQNLDNQDDNEQKDSEPYQQSQPQPQFAQVQGKVIKLSGLDYNLLNQQKRKQMLDKQNFIESLRNKVNIISGNVFDRTLNNNNNPNFYERNQQQNSILVARNKKIQQKDANLIKIINQSQPSFHQTNHPHSITTAAVTVTNKISNKRNQIYLQFELDQFGKRIPNRLQKRIGKVSNKPVYVHFDEGFFMEFKKLANQRQKKYAGRNKLDGGDGDGDGGVLGGGMENQDISDDMFGDDSDKDQDQQQNNQMQIQNNNINKKQSKFPKQKPTKINIEIGKKLNFGLDNDQDFTIFSTQKRQKPIQSSLQQNTQTNDKYFFMPKQPKKRPNLNPAQDDGYGECYHQSGPSLQELVDMKKQGIQYYGDLKEFKAKERKAPNINKEYQMVKRIIQKKNKQ